MRKIIYILAIVFPVLVIGQTQTENYIKSTAYSVETTDGTTKITGGAISPEEKTIGIQYFDGLGRPKQSINVGAGGNQEDIITHFSHDQYGRQVKDFLPYSDGSYNQDIRMGNIETLTKSFYQGKYPNDFSGITNVNDVNAYSEKRFESSPLNRVLEQGAPGTDWAVNKESDSDHTIKFEYSANSVADAIKLFNVDVSGTNPVLNSNANYAARELYKTITKDENWKPTLPPAELKNHTTEEFKDKQGRVVLKRTYGASKVNGTLQQSVAHDTYYVYDDYGNLTFVLPPKMNASTNSIVTIRNLLNDLGYQYKYDERNRLIEKRIPGKDKELIIYDNLDRPVLTQDANLRAHNKWLFTKYDILGRVTYTGVFTTTTQSESLLRTLFKNKSAQDNYEEKVNSGTGYQDSYYTNTDFPNTGIELLTINYYDNYTFNKAGLSVPSSSIFGQAIIPNGNQTKGLATGSKVRVLETTHFITTITGYDAKARALYVATYNPYLKTQDEVQNKVDFIGKVLKSRTRHQFDNHQEVVTLDTFMYDHANRLIDQFQCIGDDALTNNCTTTLTANLTLSNPNITGNQTATNSITISGPTIIAPGSHIFITDANAAGSEMIVENTYDELGQLERKKVGNTSASPLQVVDYTYNIRGWLKQINNPTSLGNDLFSFKLNYNTTNHGGTNLFNGNIAETEWKTANDNTQRWYKYNYDALNRITGAYDNTNNYSLGTYNTNGALITPVSYDKNGNILNLERRGKTHPTAATYGVLDNLSYSYNGNKLIKVEDAVSTVMNHGFKNRVNQAIEYQYDANGNMTKDDNKGIAAISYNHLNLPTQVTIANTEHNGNISYIYDATGVKLKKIVSTTGATTTYADNYVYENGSLKFFNHPEGYVDTESGYSYVYQYKDHLGNVRLSYSDSDKNGSVDSSEILEENNYYPFGLEHKGYNNVVNGTENKYQTYNGKEKEEELGKNTLAYGWRDYDPAIGRFNKIDRFAEKYVSSTPYNYAANNPMYFIDVQGDSLWIQHEGNKILYQNGNVYNKDGTAYTGKGVKTKKDGTTKLTGFLKTAVNGLTAIAKGAEGSSMISELQSSDNNFTIVSSSSSEHKATNSFKAYANQWATDPAQAGTYAMLQKGGKDFSGGSGGTIYWNSSGTSLMTTKGNRTSATTDLAHEMFHALDANRGMLDDRVHNGLKRSEWQATYRENTLRTQLGLPARTMYKTKAIPTGVRVLTPAPLNKPIKPTWYK